MVGTVQAKWRVKYLGRVIEDCVFLTDVWVKDDGQWRALRRHSTPAPDGRMPARLTRGENRWRRLTRACARGDNIKGTDAPGIILGAL